MRNWSERRKDLTWLIATWVAILLVLVIGVILLDGR